MRTPRNPRDPRRLSMPDAPLTAMGEAAAQLHEVYTAYVEAGFLPHQALYLVGMFVNPANQPPTPPPGPHA